MRMFKCISKTRGFIFIICEGILLNPLYDYAENNNLYIYKFHTIFFILISCTLLYLGYISHFLEYRIIIKEKKESVYLIKKLFLGIERVYKVTNNVEYITGDNSSYLGILHITSVILKLKDGNRFVLNTVRKRGQRFEDTDIYKILFHYVLNENKELEHARDSHGNEIMYTYTLR